MTDSANYSCPARNLASSREARSQYPRVLFLPWIGDDPDGCSLAMSRGLTKEGWKATLESGAIAKTQASGIQLPRLSSRLGGKLRAMKAMVRSIPKHDLIHIGFRSANQIVREGLLALVMARFFGKKVVVHFASAETERLLEQKRKWLMPFLRLADTIVVGSRYLQKAFGRVGLEARVLVQPRSIEKIEHRVRTNLQPRIMVNCALESDLNVGCAIRAYKLVKQKYPRAELVVVGDGAERSRLQNLTDQDTFYDVDFRTKLNRTEIGKLYDSCDMLVHTPMVDESPDALVRAFASGLPVVVTDADGLLHMVREGTSALIAAAGDHVAVADSIIELIENSELAEKFSQQGRTLARKYTWARVRQDWVNLYAELWV